MFQHIHLGKAYASWSTTISSTGKRFIKQPRFEGGGGANILNRLPNFIQIWVYSSECKHSCNKNDRIQKHSKLITVIADSDNGVTLLHQSVVQSSLPRQELRIGGERHKLIIRLRNPGYELGEICVYKLIAFHLHRPM